MALREAAISAAVGRSKSVRSGSPTPKVSLSRETSCMARSEVAAELEEVVMDSNVVDTERLGPQPAQCLFRRVRRHDPLRGVDGYELCRRQRAEVDLPVGCHWDCVDHCERRREHRLR